MSETFEDVERTLRLSHFTIIKHAPDAVRLLEKSSDLNWQTAEPCF